MAFSFLLICLSLVIGSGSALRAPLSLSAASAAARHPPARAFSAWASELAAHGRLAPNASFLRAGAILRAARAAAMRNALRGGRLEELLDWGRSLAGVARAGLEAAGAAPDDTWVNAACNLSTAMGMPRVWVPGARAVVSHAAQLPGADAWVNILAAGRRPRNMGHTHSPNDHGHDMLTGQDVPVQGLLFDGVFVLDAAQAADCEGDSEPPPQNPLLRCLVGGVEKVAPSLVEAEAEAQLDISYGLTRLADTAQLSMSHARSLPALNAAVYSVGSRTLIMVSATLSDVQFPSPLTGVEPSVANLQAICARAASNLTRSAHGAATFSCRVHPSTIALGASSSSNMDTWVSLARTQLAASSAGYDLSSASHIILGFPSSSLFDFGGLGSMPGNKVSLNCDDYRNDGCVGTILHEVGHNLGLDHASTRYIGTNAWEECEERGGWWE